ncbi:hypothetical protein [Terrabacter sp. NPDC000476]|uniref:hypothetical protein n=1 Tax=Terrabacter sp. NPDC000476 TaxID=3154258 RepID=UPI003317AF36
MSATTDPQGTDPRGTDPHGTDPHGTDVHADLDHPNPPEATAMNQHTPDETPDLTFSDPTADPTPAPSAANDPTASVPTNAGDTAAIPSGATRTMPAAGPAPTTPFRVESHAPVPDDAVVPGSDLPHLPPPGTTRPDPAWAPPAPPAPPAAPTPAPRPVLVTVRRGPRPGAIMFGLLTMLVAAYLVVGNVTDADLSLDQVGPSMIGAFGGVLLLVGLAGVVAGRLRR